MRERRRSDGLPRRCALAAVLLVGACTNDDADGTARSGDRFDRRAPPPADQHRGHRRHDQDRLADASTRQALVEAGLATDLGDVIGLAQAIVDDWNADGGINGRAGRAGRAAASAPTSPTCSRTCSGCASS